MRSPEAVIVNVILSENSLSKILQKQIPTSHPPLADKMWVARSAVTKPRRAQGSSALAQLAGANKTNVAIEVDVEPIDVHDPPLAIPAEIQHATAAATATQDGAS